MPEFNIVMESISNLNPDHFTFEELGDERVFFTIKKGTFSFYLQTSEHEKISLLAIFKGDNKLPSHEGNTVEILGVVHSLCSGQ